MENRIVEIENQIAELQKDLRDTLREIVIAKLSKLNMLKGSSKVSTVGYKNADDVAILSIWLNDKGDGLGYTFYVGSKPAPFTPEDYKFFLSKVDEVLEEWLPLEPYMGAGEVSAEVKYTDVNSPEYNKITTISGDSLHKLYIKFYGLNRRLRYCNGCSYSFVDPDRATDYRCWERSLPESLSRVLYYGNGVID